MINLVLFPPHIILFDLCLETEFPKELCVPEWLEEVAIRATLLVSISIGSFELYYTLYKTSCIRITKRASIVFLYWEVYKAINEKHVPLNRNTS